MRKITFFAFLFPVFNLFSQVDEHFTDGDFTHNPTWTGTDEHFVVDENFRLRSSADAASQSYLFTPSESFVKATWECWVRIEYPTSQYNYAAFYIASDRNSGIDTCNAYYVRIGGASDAVSLFVQRGTTKTEIIKGASQRLVGDTVEVQVRVTRNGNGHFELYSRLAGEEDYVKEGSVDDSSLERSRYVGVMFSNSSATGHRYCFDDIVVTGEPGTDTTAPQWVSVKIVDESALLLSFSEEMDYSSATFEVDHGVGKPLTQSVADDGWSLHLDFGTTFEEDMIYTLETYGLTDLSGNLLQETSKVFGYARAPQSGDVVLNEVMFNQPDDSYEYIEVMNVSDRLLDVSSLVFTTRKTDGTLNTGHSLEGECLLAPGACLAVTEEAETVRAYHRCPVGSLIYTMEWTTLNNTEGTVVVTDSAGTTVFDELSYKASWHHPLIRDEKGVALERISPYFVTQSEDSWHSASSETNYGTPGYRNSQYRSLADGNGDDADSWFRLDPEAFSPDNDGVDDVCFMYYRVGEPGYAANLFIFDMAGVQVARLASNDLLSTEGLYTWDGRLSNGSLANMGVYVVYFEVFHTEKGVRKVIKKPVVVSGR